MHDRKALFYAEVCVDDDRDIWLRLAIAAVKLNAGTLDRIGGTLRLRRLLNMALRFGEKVAG